MNMESESFGDSCFICCKKSAMFHNTLGSELNIRQIVCLHFWFTEDDLQSAMVCDTCWEKVAQFHQFYLDVQKIHQQLKTAISSVFIKQEEDEIDEDQLRENCIDLHGDDQEPFVMVDCKLEDTVGKCEELEKEESSPQVPQKKRKYTRRAPDERVAKPNIIRQQHKLPLEERRKATDDFIKQHTVYFCEECNLKFETYRAIRCHQVRTHNKKTIPCCGTQYKTQAALCEHVQTVLNPEEFKCELCNNTFKSHKGYLRHKRDNHAARTEPTVKSFQCHRCEKSFAEKVMLRAHLRNHETLDKGTAKCEFCSKCFSHRRFLRNHLKAVHQDPEFVCEICSKAFGMRSAFWEHRRRHDLTEEEQRKQCPVCNKWLKNHRYWLRHVQRHKEEGKDYKCKECSHVSINRMALKTHMARKHAPDKKRHVCEVCGKEYSRPATLREHVANAHTGEPLYRCQYCEKQFFSNATMYTHRKKEHPQEWLENHLAKYTTAEDITEETHS